MSGKITLYLSGNLIAHIPEIGIYPRSADSLSLLGFLTVTTPLSQMNKRILTSLCIVITVAFGLWTSHNTQGEGADKRLLNAILPTEETGAARFLAEYPEFDGRGAIVAILDTGVDPGARALSTTPQGEPKFVDLIDATGDGDVDMQEIRESREGILVGLTGRKLTIDPNWTNPTGKFRVGIKAGYDLFPSGQLVERLKQQRRDAWMQVQRERLQQLQEESRQNAPEGLSKPEREARIAALQAAIASYDDPGPVYDCVLFHDGEVWRAVVDTDEDGDLTNEVLLTDYDREPRFATFGQNSALNFTVHIYEEGNVLSLVTVSGDHGTHVAGIVAAYDPEHPERNGVAPGARLVSIKIGDGRLGGMETGRALTRVVPAVLKHRVDLINMSYGEPSTPANTGRIVEHFSQLVREHNIIFVASAGNAGPGLSTVGSPGGTSSALIGVGAYVSQAMMEAQYGLRETAPDTGFTWTSRGPTADGDQGVNIFAPGGAITSVPTYSLQPARQMNGTSMAAPNACGNIALLVSGLKAREIPYNHSSILRALQHTAEPIPGADAVAQGPGLLQVDRAFAHLTAEGRHPDELIEIAVSVSGGGRGIYLREPGETSAPIERTVTLAPRFPKATENARKLDYEVTLQLEATADWISVGRMLVLPLGPRPLGVLVDPTGLEPGVHVAEIRGYDARSPERGPLVRIPVTVVRGEEVGDAGRIHWELESGPGETLRRFVTVPEHSETATIRMKRRSGPGTRFGYLLAAQLVPGATFEATHQEWVARLEGTEVFEQQFSVIPGRLLELCWGQYFTSLGRGEFELEVQFHGLRLSTRQIALSPAQLPVRLDLSNHLQHSTIAPAGELTVRRQLLVPVKSSLTASRDERDQLPDSRRLQRLRLEYQVNLTGAEQITLRCPALEDLLYESPLDGLLLTVLDEHNAICGTQDMFAEETTSFPAGRSTILLDLFHTEESQLKRWEGVLLALDRKLSRSVNLVGGSSPAELAGGNPRLGSTELLPGDQHVSWWGGPALSGITAEPGDLLLGELRFGSSQPALKVPVTVAVPVKGSAPVAAPQKSAALDRSKSASAALNEFRLERLAALQYPADKEEIDQLTAELEAAGADLRRLAVIRLHLIDSEAHREEHLADVVSAADRVLKTIPAGKVQSYFGIRQQPETEAEKKLHAERTAQRKDLIDALHRKTRALLLMELPEVLEKHPVENPEQHAAAIRKGLRQLGQWVDLEEAEYVLLKIRNHRRQEEYGQAIQLLRKDLARPGKDDWRHHKKLRDMYAALGWSDWSDYEDRWMLRRFPGPHEE